MPGLFSGEKKYPCWHPLHEKTGLIMCYGGSAFGFIFGISTWVIAKVDPLPEQFATAGLALGVASIVTAFMPALLRVINWRIEEAREDRKAREARHGLANKIQVNMARLDLHDEVIRKALQHIRAAYKEQERAIYDKRAWMVRVSKEHNIPLPESFGHRAFDNPEWHRSIDRLFQILDINPAQASPDPDRPAVGLDEPSRP